MDSKEIDSLGLSAIFSRIGAGLSGSCFDVLSDLIRHDGCLKLQRSKSLRYHIVRHILSIRFLFNIFKIISAYVSSSELVSHSLSI